MMKPISNTVTAKGHTPQYRMHKYFARRPYNVFRNLIEHYSNKGDIILDCFCGGGVTIFEGLSLDRRVIGVDINPLATFITEMQIQQIDIEKLINYYEAFHVDVKNKFSKLYHFEIESKLVNPEWVEWVYEVECAECSEIITLSENNKISNGKYKCSNLDCITNKGNKSGVGRTKCKPHASLPIRMRFITDSKDREVYIFSEEEATKIKDDVAKLHVTEDSVNIDFEIPHNWDRWYEDCLPQKGVYRFSDLFTNRNLYINLMIFNKILELPKDEYRDLLYFAFSSSLRYTNNMSRVTENWENGNPTCMDKHAYWLPNEYVELNVIEKLQDRMNVIINGLKFTNTMINSNKEKAYSFEDIKNGKDYLILTQSASQLDIPDNTVDVIITDPPYGSNVQYGELSSFWNVWYMKYMGLDNFIFNEEEAVANRKNKFKGAKSIKFYGDMVCSVFTEAGRVLKTGGYLVFTFNNKNINVWVQLLRAVVNAGFYLPDGGVIFQDFIKKYKNTSHLKYSGNIHGDFIYSFCKGELQKNEKMLGDFEETLRLEISECINDMYKIKDEYTTTELYEIIFGKLVRILMQFIHEDENIDDDLVKIENLSNTFIDNVITQQLSIYDNKWRKKELFVPSQKISDAIEQ